LIGYGIAQPVTCTESIEVNLVLWFDISTSSMHRRLTIQVSRGIDAYWYSRHRRKISKYCLDYFNGLCDSISYLYVWNTSMTDKIPQAPKPFTKKQLEIVEKALKIIAEKGVNSLTIKTLAQELQLTEGAIYRHFTSKDEIICAIITIYRIKSNKILEGLKKEKSSYLEKIEKFFMDRINLFIGHPSISSVILSNDLYNFNEEVKKNLQETIKEHQKILKDFILKGQKNLEIKKDINARYSFLIIFGSLRMLVNQWLQSGYQLNLKAEGTELWITIRALIEQKE